MQFNTKDDGIEKEAMNNAERLMRAGKWEQAEAIIREYCIHPSELTLTMALLQIRKEGAEYASTLDWDELGREGIWKAIEQQCDHFTADWILNEYKGI